MYKIQHRTANGWTDIKVKLSDGRYHVDVFTAKENAEQEIKDLIELLGHSPEDYKVVDITVQEEYNMY